MMTTPFDSRVTEPAVDNGLMRLLHFDMPAIEKTGKTLPERFDTPRALKMLDIACGSGEWTLRTAQAYPQVQAIGIDRQPQLIEGAYAQAKARGLQNVEFKVMDLLRSFEFPDGYFDLVHARFIVNMLPAEAWPALLQECRRILAPGGSILLTESDLPSSTGSAFEQLNGMVSRACWLAKRGFSPDGRVFSITPMLEYLVQNAGYQDIQSKTQAVNFSAGMEAHDAIYRDFVQSYRLVQPFLVKMGVTTQEEVEQVYQRMLQEMLADDFCAVGFYLTVSGKKP